MSLEAALADNTAALKEHTEQLKIANAGRDAAIAAAQALQSGDKAPPKPRAAAAKKDDKPAGPPSIDDVRAAFGAYLGVEDEAEREARKAKVKKILELCGGAGKATEIPEEHRAQAITWVKALTAGEDVAELADEEEEPAEEALI